MQPLRIDKAEGLRAGAPVDDPEDEVGVEPVFVITQASHFEAILYSEERLGVRESSIAEQFLKESLNKSLLSCAEPANRVSE